MTTRRPDSEAVAKQAILACEKLYKQGALALDSAFDARSPLRARGYGHGPVGKGVVVDTTMDIACARAERTGPDAYDELVRVINDLEVVALRLRGLIDRQVQKAPMPAERRRSGAGICVACGKGVSGAGEDRVKSGLCPEHYTGSRRSHLERKDYIDAVRREGRGNRE